MDVRNFRDIEFIGTRKDKSLDLLEKATKQVLTSEECKALCNKNNIEYLSGYEDQVFQFILTDATVDRYNEVILAKGVDFELYKTNPVVLTFHNSHQYPVGSCIKIWYDKPTESIKGWILFMDDRVDSSGASSVCMKMVKGGFLKTGSIGFVAKKAHQPTTEELIKYNFKDPQFALIYDEIELMEYSIVPIPANPSAKSESLTKMLSTFSPKEKDFLRKSGGSELLTDDNVINTSLGVAQTVNTTLENKTDTDSVNKASGSDIDKTLKSDYNVSKIMKIKANINPETVTTEAYNELLDSFKKLAAEGHDVELTIGEQVIADPIGARAQIVDNTKAGASISKKNKAIIKAAVDSCHKMVGDLQPLIDEIEDEEEEKKLIPTKTFDLIESQSKQISSMFKDLLK